MITVKEIENLANLSRIKLDEKEKQSLTKEIDSILTYVDTIKKATVDMDYTPVPGAVHNVFRTDEPTSVSSDDRKQIIASAPDHEGEFVAVKKILPQNGHL